MKYCRASDQEGRAEIAGMLRNLRCIGCSREPTPTEVDEMICVFGHKVTPIDAPALRWECLGCQTERFAFRPRVAGGRPS
jgi:hypothetical protein